MDYEKKYKEALERAIKFLNKELFAENSECAIKHIFPELVMSEDERIRKAIIDFFSEPGRKEYILKGFAVDDILAWLEKQGVQKTVDEIAKEVCKDKASAVAFLKSAGIMNEKGEIAEPYRQDEQRHTDKVEPKFKVGDWIIDIQGVSVDQIMGIEYDDYLIKTSCSQFYLPIKLTEKNYRLWTIEDAKDGDVLQLGEVTAIFKEYIGNGDCKCYCSVYRGEFEIPTQDSSYGCYNATPATKEQRELLFQKMKEAGYEWNAEKKELKIEQSPIDVRTTGYWHVEDVEQKPAWSEEDKKYLRRAINATRNGYPETNNWLKSLKERYTWKPSDEQMDNLSRAFNGSTYQVSLLRDLYLDLKKLKG